MAIAFSTTGESAKRTTNLVASTTDYTCLQLTKLNTVPTTPGDYTNIWLATNSIGVYDKWIEIFYSGFNGLKLSIEMGSGPQEIVYGTITAGVEFATAYTRSGTTHSFYANGKLIGSTTINVSGLTIGEMYIGSDTFDTLVDLNVQNFREWTRALTLAEIIAEANSTVAATSSSLYTDTPLLDDLLDDSGNGHTWTTVGTTSFTTSATPIPYSNTTSTTAYAITSFDDVNFTEVIQRSGTVNESVWYKYTGTTGDNQLGIRFYTSGTTTPSINMFGPNQSTTLYNNIGGSGVNVPLSFPSNDGETYYFRIFNASTTNAAILNINTLKHTDVSVPVGAFLVNDDTPGLSAAFVSSTTDNYVFYFKKGIVAGEDGDVIPGSGEILLADADTPALVLYNSQLEQIAVFSTLGGYDNITARAGKFYICDSVVNPPNASVIKTISSTGVVGSTTWTLPTSILSHIAVSPDESILYYSRDNLIKRYDLVNSTTLSDLTTAPPAGYQITSREFLCLDDGTVVVPYRHPLAVHDFYVQRFDTTGTVLNTYTFPFYPTVSNVRMAHSINDPTTFWIWLEGNASGPYSPIGYAFYYEVVSTTGAFATERIQAEYEVGAAHFPFQLNGPNNFRFGQSESCPFVVIRQAIPVSTPGSGGTVVVTKMTDPASDTTAFAITISTLGTISLAGGNSTTFTNVTAGTYSFVETTTTTHDSIVVVSNGTPSTAVSVSIGETVTVTFTNFLLEPLSGLYILVPDKKYDTVYAEIRHVIPGEEPTFTTEDREIPEPSAELYLAGDE